MILGLQRFHEYANKNSRVILILTNYPADMGPLQVVYLMWSGGTFALRVQHLLRKTPTKLLLTLVLKQQSLALGDSSCHCENLKLTFSLGCGVRKIQSANPT